MNDEPPSPPGDTPEAPKLSALLVCFHYSGVDNGLPKEGFDSRVIKVPADALVETSEDVQILANAIATSEFSHGRKYVGLEITIVFLSRLPI